ncbi:MAG TPA: RNA polymerase sigma factor [Thermoanaerobaculia bacterium]
MDAFDEAYAQHYPGVLRFVRGMLGARGDAADVAQETFLRLHAQRPDASEVRFWLFRVARNLAINELRRVSIRERLAHLIAFSPPRDPQALTIAEEERRRLGDALAKLPADQRAALLLREWEGLSYDEIASTAGCSVAKVKSDLFRARQTLRAAFGRNP